jgi:hypothetical protein
MQSTGQDKQEAQERWMKVVSMILAFSLWRCGSRLVCATQR